MTGGRACDVSVRIGILRALAVSIVVCMGAVPAAAQSGAPWPGRITLSAGGLFMGGSPLGASEATLTQNAEEPGAFRLFRTQTELDLAAGFEGRLGVRLTRIFTVEGGFTLVKPQIVTRLSADAEDAAPVSATSTLSQYVIDASLVADLATLAFGDGRGLPFVSGGGGYLRQLHEGGILAATGRVVHAGGGVKYLFRRSPGRFIKGVGVRAEARLYLRSGGLDFGDTRRTFAGGGAGLLLLF